MGFLSDQVSVLILAGICLFGCFSGCGQTNPSTFPVAGRVLLDGQPLEGAAVMLKPVDGGSNGYGVADAEGRFEITTYRQRDGAIPGEHRIIVTLEKVVQPVGVEPGEEDQEGLDDGMELAVSNQGEVISAVPSRYTNFETSGLTVVVGPDTESLQLKLTNE